jgi:hypothetical protein
VENNFPSTKFQKALIYLLMGFSFFKMCCFHSFGTLSVRDFEYFGILSVRDFVTEPVFGAQIINSAAHFANIQK